MSDIEIVLNMDKLMDLIDQLDPRAEGIIKKAAFQCEVYQKLFVPIDTHALQNSIKVEMVSPLEAHIGPHMDYGIYQEFGWTSSNGHHNPGQPYVYPALYQVRAEFDAMWKDLLV